jgi:hypothetical protein
MTPSPRGAFLTVFTMSAMNCSRPSGVSGQSMHGLSGTRERP